MDWNKFSFLAGLHHEEYVQASTSLAHSHGAAVHSKVNAFQSVSRKCSEFYTQALAAAESEDHLKLIIEHVKKLNNHTRRPDFLDIEDAAKSKLGIS